MFNSKLFIGGQNVIRLYWYDEYHNCNFTSRRSCDMKYMLLFNLAIATPDGGAQDEIINVYSKHFETKAKCEQFLDDYQGLIHGHGLKSFQSMFKKGYTVTLKSVTCDQPVKSKPLKFNGDGSK